MTIRTSARQFISKNFPTAAGYRFFTSRLFETADKPSYYDDWWFQFPVTVLDEADFIVFAGAMDQSFSDFRVFKVPTEYLRSNFSSIDVNAKGIGWMYIHRDSFQELRKKAGISFKPFVLT
jgi:hypothetical protein